MIRSIACNRCTTSNWDTPTSATSVGYQPLINNHLALFGLALRRHLPDHTWRRNKHTTRLTYLSFSHPTRQHFLLPYSSQVPRILKTLMNKQWSVLEFGS